MSMQASVDVQGRERSFTVVGEPGGDGTRPLVLVFHGSGQTGSVHRRFTGGQYDSLAEHGTVVAYLDGHGRHWNDARLRNGSSARREDVDDVAFVDAVIDHLATTHGISRAAVYGIGFSNGGQMVMRLLLEPGGRLAGAAVIAATLPVAEDLVPSVSAAHARPVPLLLVHGTADPISPYSGGRFSWWARRMFHVAGRMRSFAETAAFFAGVNGVAGEPAALREEEAGNGTAIERRTYSAPGAPPVVTVTVHGGGHTVPGPVPGPRIMGRTASAPSGAQLAAELFGLPR